MWDTEANSFIPNYPVDFNHKHVAHKKVNKKCKNYPTSYFVQYFPSPLLDLNRVGPLRAVLIGLQFIPFSFSCQISGGDVNESSNGLTGNRRNSKEKLKVWIINKPE